MVWTGTCGEYNIRVLFRFFVDTLLFYNCCADRDLNRKVRSWLLNRFQRLSRKQQSEQLSSILQVPSCRQLIILFLPRRIVATVILTSTATTSFDPSTSLLFPTCDVRFSATQGDHSVSSCPEGTSCYHGTEGYTCGELSCATCGHGFGADTAHDSPPRVNSDDFRIPGIFSGQVSR